ncbi:MAG: 4Fe-4S binding protein [Bacteroidetes bacterium]|jgi:NAD-dependent dihydropyrimidine dehydrogenase PreA subunit|nr:4Fe-4S binding protein [Bacteroidota bacterium]MBT5529790.1 4Fe-4S binding protein [Cytophagia bacterium]MBT3422559.1 4Fe-4S binding protein [Bacteroidota bacterium]MBT3800495.1 4Fe-4S binding protein [Bacteroidota bacterium]MBT3934184.1 4Fe-4S binding protein [Bacteroidota bacterium]
MIREIIKIDEDLCNGCGLCIPGCPEGALQIIDGKARLVSDLMCDGLGACIGDCPEGAIEIEKREAEPYDEIKVIEIIATQHGKNTTIAHLKHLKDHGEHDFMKQAVGWLSTHADQFDFDFAEVRSEVHNYKAGGSGHHHNHEQHQKTEPMSIQSMHGGGGCPGSQSMDFRDQKIDVQGLQLDHSVSLQSELRQWPVQMHLINPNAPYFQNADVVLAADCVAFSIANFHQDYLKGKSLAIACPKLDSNQEIYMQKLVGMIDSAKINTLTVMIMEVPCCGGLIQMAKQAVSQAGRNIPLKMIKVGIKGDILQEEWV